MSTVGQRLADGPLPVGQVEATAGPHQVEVAVVDADRLGVLVDGVRVRGPVADPVATAERLAEQLRPGGEPMRVNERAPELGGATMRSPRRADGRYFEVHVDGQGAELHQQRVGPDGQRQREPFGLTREQLGQAIDALTGAMANEPGGAAGSTST
jgi:hypothetical protein